MNDCPASILAGRKAHSFAAEAKVEAETDEGREAAEQACEAIERLLDAEKQAAGVEA